MPKIRTYDRKGQRWAEDMTLVKQRAGVICNELAAQLADAPGKNIDKNRQSNAIGRLRRHTS
jgi:hypothetical protein